MLKEEFCPYCKEKHKRRLLFILFITGAGQLIVRFHERCGSIQLWFTIYKYICEPCRKLVTFLLTLCILWSNADMVLVKGRLGVPDDIWLLSTFIGCPESHFILYFRWPVLFFLLRLLCIEILILLSSTWTKCLFTLHRSNFFHYRWKI